MAMAAIALALTFGLGIGYLLGKARLEEAKQEQYQQGRADEYQHHVDARKFEQHLKTKDTLRELQDKIAKLEAKHQTGTP